jgi:squalene synthase HpnC
MGTTAGEKGEAERLGLDGALRGGGVPATVREAFVAVKDAAEAEAYTRKLAEGHYENFSVVSLLLPRRLRQDFCNVYAFCRVADDLGDEVPERERALQYLGEFRKLLEGMYAGMGDKETGEGGEEGRSIRPPKGGTPNLGGTAVFTALKETVRRHEIPMKPFDDLIRAFEQDQTMTRYETFAQVVDYCTKSADPVGRIVLYMCGYRDEERQRLSDKTCTALQLINFWQDVRRDILERDRIYLPAEDMRRFGVTEEQLRGGQVTEGFRELIKCEVERTEGMFAEGEKLLPLLGAEYRKQITLFGKGGRAICEAVRRQGFDTLTKRPRLSKWGKVKLVLGTMMGVGV